MSEQEKNHTDEEALNCDATPDSEEGEVKNSQAGAQTRTQEEYVDDRIAELEQQVAEAKKNEHDTLLRTKAEVENMRRRVATDIEKAHKFALEKFAAALLPVIDNLERALNLTDKNNPELTATVEGVELTLKSLLDTVEKFGIETIQEEGVPFNPDLHQAMGLVDSPDHPANTVLNVAQKGYSLNGRLLRPAMVMVSK